MNLALKTVVYEMGDELYNFINKNNYASLGFDCVNISNDYHDLFVHNSQNKMDILVVSDKGMDRDSLSYILDIVYNNFCQKILIVTDKPYNNDSYAYLDVGDVCNFDLKLSMKLLELKRQIDSSPKHNTTRLRNKIMDILYEYRFCSKHLGFKYYVDAVLRAYLSFPFEYSTMKLYEEIALSYGKTPWAVEKNMRKALFYANKTLETLPLTPENVKLKNQLGHSQTNNLAISLIVGKLLAGGEHREEETFSVNS